MLESVWVKIVRVGYCLADKGHTLHSKLLFDLVPTGQLGEPQAYRHVPRDPHNCYIWAWVRAYIFKIVCFIGIEIGRHTLCASHRALDQVIGHVCSGRCGNATRYLQITVWG